MIESFLSTLQQYQLGTVPGWGLLISVLLFWWKGLPSAIEAWEKRSNGIEARLNASMLAYTERMDTQLAEADKAHKECQEEQKKLRARVNEQDGVIATQNKTIAELTATNVKLGGEVQALKASHMQAQITFVAEKTDATENMKTMLGHLREIK